MPENEPQSPTVSGQTDALRGELASVIKHFSKIYLGDPEKMKWHEKLLFSFSGAFFFSTLALWKIEILYTQVTHEISRNTEGGRPSIDNKVIDQLLSFSQVSHHFFLYIYVLSMMIICGIITVGIKRGGPLRLFFLGVTIPALLIAIVNQAIPNSYDVFLDIKQ